MSITIIPDFHGVSESVYQQIRFIGDGLDFPPKKTVILPEPIPENFNRYLEGLSPLNIDRIWHKLDLESHWGPSEPYRDLLEFAADRGIHVRGLDHDLKDRYQLLGQYRQLLIEYGGSGVSKDIISRFDNLKLELTFAREKIFCQNIMDSVRAGYEEIFPTMHISHADRCRSFFEGEYGLKTTVHGFDERLESAMSEEEAKIQLGCTDGWPLKKYTKMPLVPAVFLAYDIIRE